MTTSLVALPDLLDPMYWLGAHGVFGHAVLPGILLIVFIETGLLFPLLPGESLLFTGGLLAASANPPVSIEVLAVCVAVVAVLGDQTGYFIGRRIGPALFKKEDSRFFKKHYVTESHAFFEKYGPMAIILARFMPFVWTFTPVVAGCPICATRCSSASTSSAVSRGARVRRWPAISSATSASCTRTWKRSSWESCSCRCCLRLSRRAGVVEQATRSGRARRAATGGGVTFRLRLGS